MKKNHGVLGIFGWGLILPTGAIIARYFKHRDPLWYYLHIVIQFTGFIIGLAGVVLGRALYGKIHAKVPTHRGIGFFILALSIMQVDLSLRSSLNSFLLLHSLSSSYSFLLLFFGAEMH